MEASPNGVECQSDLASSYKNLGDVAQAGGDFAAARAFFEKSLDLRKALDLAISHLRRIGVALASKDTAAVRNHKEAANAILDRLDREGKGKGNAMVARIRAYLAGLDKSTP